MGVNAESYQRLLSRSRKYAFGLVLANQQTVQISSDLLQEILRNVSTLLSFNVSHLDATKLHKEFLLSMGEQADHIPTDFLQTLKVGEAWGKIGSTVFPFTTMLADQNPDPIRAKEVIERSRINYGMPAIQPATNGKSHFLKNPVQKPVEEPKIDEPVMNHKQSFPDPSKVF